MPRSGSSGCRSSVCFVVGQASAHAQAVRTGGSGPLMRTRSEPVLTDARPDRRPEGDAAAGLPIRRVTLDAAIRGRAIPKSSFDAERPGADPLRSLRHTVNYAL
jgi:hypothetical protein